MLTLEADPPAAAPPGEPFVQCLRLLDGGSPVAAARWYAPGDLASGVVQILDFTTRPPHRRQGHGGRLMEALVARAAAHHRARRATFRRLWLVVEQKNQVIARAFLMKHGFHHVVTVSDLLRGQDALAYVRTLD